MVSFPRYFTVCITYQPPLVYSVTTSVTKAWALCSIVQPSLSCWQTESEYIYFFSSTTLYEFWLAQLYPSIVSSLAPSVSSSYTPIFFRSFLTSSSHLNLGLPLSLVAYGIHLYMVLTTLSFGILSTCTNQLNILLLTH